jgi:hypothetical protein
MRRVCWLILCFLLVALLPVAPASADHEADVGTAHYVAPVEGAQVGGTAYKVLIAEHADSTRPPTLFLDGVALQTKSPQAEWEQGSYNQQTGYWEMLWDTTAHANGPHKLQVGSYFDGPNATAPVNITIANTAPQVTRTAPAEGTKVAGNVVFRADAVADASMGASVTKVVFDFHMDTSNGETDYTAPYEVTIDTAAWFAEGLKRYSVIAYDSQGRTTTSEGTVFVDNHAPVALLSPVAGQVLSGVASVRAQDGEGGTAAYPYDGELTLYIDGRQVWQTPTRTSDGKEGWPDHDTYTWSWDTRTIADGDYLIQLGADHREGPITEPVKVTVDNSTQPPANQVPAVSVSPFVVKFGQTANVTISGTPGATVDLYIRKYRGDFIKIRNGLVLDATGRTTVPTKPDMNLRFMAKDRTVAEGSSIGGVDGLMTVEKYISINVARVGVNRYTFSGSINPMHPGAVVHLYRNGTLFKSSIAVSSSRVYTWTGTLPKGAATFRITSPTTGHNNISHSPTRSVSIY